MARPLEDKVALVTGASRGIGRAIARGYADAGATVLCVARSARALAQTVADIEASGGHAAAYVGDVTDRDRVSAVFSQVAADYGGIDIAVLNAGVGDEPVALEASDPEHWTQVVTTNLFGAYYCARAAIPLIKIRGGGRIVMVGSGLGHHGHATHSAYAVSKAGVWMLVRVLADEVAGDHISVNELIPGPVRTHMTRPATDPSSVFSIESEWIKQPQDVVPLALFLATHPEPGPTGQSFSLMRRTR